MLLFGVVDCLWMCSLSPAHHASGKWRLYNTMLQLCACCKYFFCDTHGQDKQQMWRNVASPIYSQANNGYIHWFVYSVIQTDRWPSVVARRHSNGHRLGYLFSKTVQELQSCKQNGARLASKGTFLKKVGKKNTQYCLLIGDWCRNLLICISTYIFIHSLIYSCFSCWIAPTSHNVRL